MTISYQEDTCGNDSNARHYFLENKLNNQKIVNRLIFVTFSPAFPYCSIQLSLLSFMGRCDKCQSAEHVSACPAR